MKGKMLKKLLLGLIILNLALTIITLAFFSERLEDLDHRLKEQEQLMCLPR